MNYNYNRRHYEQQRKMRKKSGCFTTGFKVCLWVFAALFGLYVIGTIVDTPRGEVYTYEQYQELVKQQQEETKESTVPMTNTVSDTEPLDEPPLKLKTGELLSVITNERDGMQVIIIKAKIQGLSDNDMTVDQNYYNACDLITRQGCDRYDELQYWAVADMANGSEEKVIAFTLNKQTIQGIKDEHILPKELTVYSDDLWIHPSLNSTTYASKTTTAPTTTSKKKQETTTAQEVPAYTTIESRETEPTLSDTQTPRNIILNTDTHCFHLSGNCSAAKRIIPGNRQDEYTTIENVKARGYTACGICAKKYKD